MEITLSNGFYEMSQDEMQIVVGGMAPAILYVLGFALGMSPLGACILVGAGCAALIGAGISGVAGVVGCFSPPALIIAGAGGLFIIGYGIGEAIRG